MSTIHRKGQALGWGSFATVFKGWDELLDRQVAIKELIPPFGRHDAFIRLYLGQALKMVDLAHPHVLATYGVETNRNPPAITRELADETLAHQLIEGPIPVEPALRILRHALAGLGALHARDLVHGAIKPENLFVCGETYKIGDFGIRPFDGAPQFPSRLLKYAAPELLSSQEDASTSSDLYSLGVVMHELLLGPIRFEKLVEATLEFKEGPGEEEDMGRDADRLWEYFHRSPATLPPLHEIESTIPVALSLVLRKMAAKDPAERYTSHREILAALGTADLAENLDATLSMTLVSKSVVKPTRRGRNSLWLGSGVVFAVALAAAALIVGVKNGDDMSGPSQHPSPPSVAVQEAAKDQQDRLLGAARSDRGLSIELDPPFPENRIPVGTPLRFRVSSSRSAYLAFFAVSSNGDITCLYPAPGGESLRIGPGERLRLPLDQDRSAGFEPTATEPLGRDVYFLLASEQVLPPPPSGTADFWKTTYSFTAGEAASPAARFADWVRSLLANDGSPIRMAACEVEVVDQR